MTSNFERAEVSLQDSYRRAKSMRNFLSMGSESLPEGLECIEKEPGKTTIFLDKEHAVDLGNVEKAANKLGYFSFYMNLPFYGENRKGLFIYLGDEKKGKYLIKNSWTKLSRECLVYMDGQKEIILESGKRNEKVRGTSMEILREYLKTGNRRII